MLKQRIITALVLAAVVIGIILIPDTIWVSLLFTGGMFMATRELLALTVKLENLPAILVSAGFSILFLWSLTLVHPVLVNWQSLAGVVLWLLIACGLFFYRPSGNWPLLVRVLVLGLGLDLLWICTHGLIYLHYQFSPWTLLYLLTLVWVADIGAYFSGRRFGKHKLAPAISPGKTWEGVLGGIIANLLWMLAVFLMHDGWGLSLAQFLLIGLATSAISVVGDLFESILKREAGVKDSGKMLPGHGGVLDRVDGVIAASPVFVCGLFLVSMA